MISRFLIYPLNHTVLVVDLSEIGLPKGLYPPEGDLKMIASYRFHNRSYAERFLAAKGANPEELQKTLSRVDKGMIQVLTIT